MLGFGNLKLTPALALRIGLGLTLIYAGVNIFLDPTSWIGFVPPWVGKIIDAESFLLIHAIFEAVLGLTIFFGVFLPLAALLAFLDMFSILIFFGVDDVTFRDFGLLMAALALFLLSAEKRK